MPVEEREIGVYLLVHPPSRADDTESLSDHAADQRRGPYAEGCLGGGLHQDRFASITNGSPFTSVPVIVRAFLALSQFREIERLSADEVAVPFQVQGRVEGSELPTSSRTPVAVPRESPPF